MLIIPAIDLKDGKCVRLIQGRMQDETVYSNDPEAVARRWADSGAQMLHVVDLDAAVHGTSFNQTCIAGIIRAAGIPVQVGGGMRDVGAVAASLEAGAQRVIMGTAAVENPAFVREACRIFPNRIAVGIDARQGRVAIRGWTRTTETSAVDLARQLEDAGVCALIFTDIQRDGMQIGPNIEETRKLAASVGTEGATVSTTAPVPPSVSFTVIVTVLPSSIATTVALIVTAVWRSVNLLSPINVASMLCYLLYPCDWLVASSSVCWHVATETSIVGGGRGARRGGGQAGGGTERGGGWVGVGGGV